MIKTDADLYIIGGGIIGLCSAVELQSRGKSVVILDADKVGNGASFGNAGHLAVEQVFPFADPSLISQLPGMLLNPLGPITLDWRYTFQILPWFFKLLLNMRQRQFLQIHQALKSINGISLASWKNFSTKWGLTEWIHVNGSLLTTETLKNLHQLKTHKQRLNAMGIPTEFLTQDELRQREPLLAENQLGAVFFPETGHVTDLPKVHQRLIEHFISMGGVIHEFCKVDSLSHHVDGIELTTTQGNVMANEIMIASGAFSKSLVKQATGVLVPLDTERGYHLMLPNERARLSVPVTSMDRRFIMTPMQSGLRLAGTAEYAGLNRKPNMKRALMLKKLADPMFKTHLNDTNATQWMGCRPSTVDSLPVIDKVGRVLLNFGHQHLGLTQAVSSAEIISNLYFDEESKIDTTPFRLGRFGSPNPKLIQNYAQLR